MQIELRRFETTPVTCNSFTYNINYKGTELRDIKGYFTIKGYFACNSFLVL